MRTLLWTILAVLALSVSGRADEILLRNGNVIRGDILVETEKSVKIKVFLPTEAESDRDSSIIMEIAKERIRRVTKEGSLFKPREREDIIREKPKMVETKEATGADDETSATKPDADTPAAKTSGSGTAKKAPPKEPPLDPAMERQIKLLIQNLGDLNDTTRNQAEDRLTAIGKDAVPLVAKAVMSPQTDRQHLSAIEVLGDIGDKRVTLLLIDQLRGGRDDRLVMRKAWPALKKVTNQGIFFNEDHTPKRRDQYIDNWMRWFETVEEDYPVQIGYEGRKAALEKKKAEEEAAKAEEEAEETDDTPVVSPDQPENPTY